MASAPIAPGFVLLGLSITPGLYLSNEDSRRAQGKVRLDQDHSSRNSVTSYHVFVGAHKISFGDDMSSAFREGHAYSVYYCQSGPHQLIMSFEEQGG